MQAGPTDQELVDRCRQGDREALALLVDRHQHDVFRYLVRFTCDEDNARDLLQDTMLGVARSIGTFRGEANVVTWMKHIAHRKFQDWLRQKYRQPDKIPIDPPDDANEGLSVGPVLAASDKPGDETAQEAELCEIVHRAIAELAPSCQEVILLVDLEEMHYAEAAKRLKLSPKTLASRLSRCREKLRPKLDRLCKRLGIFFSPAET